MNKKIENREKSINHGKCLLCEQLNGNASDLYFPQKIIIIIFVYSGSEFMFVQLIG